MAYSLAERAFESSQRQVVSTQVEGDGRDFLCLGRIAAVLELVEAWSNGSGSCAKFELALSEMSATEELNAYPGPQLTAPEEVEAVRQRYVRSLS